MRTILAACGMLIAVSPAAAAEIPRLTRILIVSGGGYHDYPAQRQLLESGLEARLHVEVSHVFSDPPPDRKTRPAIPAFADPNYGDGYDLIIHNECAADESDPKVLDAVLAPHVKGIPAVNLHCAMHSFRSGDWRRPVTPGADHARWFAFTGVQSTGHGPQRPIAVSFTDHPIAKGMAPWTTPDEELYNNLTRFDVTPVAMGTQPGGDPDAILAWTHEYGPKRARVFSVTLAHNEGTMADPRYLDLIARGVAWATGHMDAKGELARAIRR